MKDPKEATEQELLDEVTAAIREGRQFEGMVEILKRTMAGKLTGPQFHAAQAKGYAEAWPEMLEAYTRGYYFGQQGMDFMSHLMLTEDEVAKDMNAWQNMKAAAEAVGGLDNLTYQDAAAFAESRVLPSYKERRAFLSVDGKNLRYNMGEKAKEHLAQRREAYQAATAKWGWPQPFGGA